MRTEEIGTVLWDGSPNRPWGRQLAIQTEKEHAATQRPYRTLSELSDEDIVEMLADARAGARLDDIAEMYHVHPHTVDHLVSATNVGIRRTRA